MELVAQELFLTAVIAVLFSFLIAKLVSMATSGGGSHPTEDPNNGVDQEVLTEEIIMEELSFSGERLQASLPLGEDKVGFVEENQERVDHVVSNPVGFLVERSQLECGELNEGSVGEKKFVGGELGLEEKREISGCDVVVERFDQEVLREDVKLESLIEKNLDEDVKLDSSIEEDVKFAPSIENDVKFESLSEKDVKFESLTEKSREDDEMPIGVVEVREPEEKVEIGAELVVGSDDDWEGIERSELEKVFAKAVKFVQSASDGDAKASVGSDLNMELYGLYKVATEGPCREQPPMPLMMSARAKWNAWQRLGNMSPDAAMEQYIACVSDKVPDWMQEKNPNGEGEPTLFHQVEFAEERIPEPKPDQKKIDSEGSDPENSAKE